MFHSFFLSKHNSKHRQRDHRRLPEIPTKYDIQPTTPRRQNKIKKSTIYLFVVVRQQQTSKISKKKTKRNSRPKAENGGHHKAKRKVGRAQRRSTTRKRVRILQKVVQRGSLSVRSKQVSSTFARARCPFSFFPRQHAKSLCSCSSLSAVHSGSSPCLGKRPDEAVPSCSWCRNHPSHRVSKAYIQAMRRPSKKIH